MTYRVVEKWANWDAQKRRVVVSGLVSREAALLEAKTRYDAQSWPFAAYVVESDKKEQS